MADWIYPLAGAALLLLLAVDVFRTAFHAQGRGGPINRRQNRAIWTVVRWAGTRGGEPRGAVLSMGGPIMAVATIGVWSLLLLAGFTLVYLPYVLGFHYSPGQPGPALLEAFYYSGIIAGTMGQGDVVAPGTALRIVTIVQGVAGFALVTVAVTYVLGVYRELVTAHGLASALHARLHGEAGDPGIRRDPGWARSITLRLAHSLEGHYNYPILHYFRPRRTVRALPPGIAALHAALRAAGPEAGPDAPGDHRSAAEDGSTRALEAMVSRYIGEVHGLFVEQRDHPDEDPDRERERLLEILDMMAFPRPGA